MDGSHPPEGWLRIFRKSGSLVPDWWLKVRRNNQEGSKKPDFIFPSSAAYHNYSFPTNKLISLAAKTTCKDRWRQILNEADRLKNGYKYLCTLQQGISEKQMEEMRSEKVVLVVPKPYIKSFPQSKQSDIWTIEKFVSFVKETEM